MSNWRWNRMGYAEQQAYICDDKKDPAQIMASFGRLTEGVFKRKATAFDFRVCAAILELIKDLPGSHGMTSVAKVLRGKAKTCTKNPNFGMCEGMKEYPQAKLFSLAENIEFWMLANNLCSDEDNKLEWDRSDPIYTRKKADHLLSTLIIQLIRDNADAYGVAAPAPQKAKELSWDKFKGTFLRWMQSDLLPDILKLTNDTLAAGKLRAHTSSKLQGQTGPYQLGRFQECSVAGCVDLMNRGILPVFNLTKSRKKDGTFGITAIVTSAFIPVGWQCISKTNTWATGNGWSELDEACTGISSGHMGTIKSKKVAQSIRVKAIVDADGNILSHEIKLEPGFCMDTMWGAKSSPEYAVDNSKAIKVWGGEEIK